MTTPGDEMVTPDEFRRMAEMAGLGMSHVRTVYPVFEAAALHRIRGRRDWRHLSSRLATRLADGSG